MKNKKGFLLAVLATVWIMGLSAQQEMDIDAAIQQAGKDITSVPAMLGARVALVNFNAPKDASEYVLAGLYRTLAGNNKLPVIAKADADRALANQKLSATGAATDQQAVTVAKALNAAYAFTGSMEKVGNNWRFNGKMLSVTDGKAKVTTTINIKESAQFAKLVGVAVPAPAPAPAVTPAPKPPSVVTPAVTPPTTPVVTPTPAPTPATTPANKTPVAEDYVVNSLSQKAGSVKAVTVTRRVGASSGAITVLYNGSTTRPTTAGTYAITFNVAAAPGWNAANELAGGNLIIAAAPQGDRTPVSNDYSVNKTSQQEGSVTPVSVTVNVGPKSPGAITEIFYSGSTTVPQAKGRYTITFNVAAAPGWKAANGLFGGYLNVTEVPYVDPTKQTPVSTDYYMVNMNQEEGSTNPVIIIPKDGKSPGAVTVFYNGRPGVETSAGNYSITFNVAAAPGWNEAKNLHAGLLTIKQPSTSFGYGLVVSTVKGKRGEEVTMVLNLQEHPGLAGLQLEINYDPNRLRLESPGKVTRMNEGISPLTYTGLVESNYKRNPFNVLWYGAKNVKQSGNILQMTFRILPDAPLGKAFVTVMVKDSINESRTTVPIKVTQGSVTVE